MTRIQRIQWMKDNGMIRGNRHARRLEKFSDSFNEIFRFFLNSYLKGILNFAGVAVDVKYDAKSYSGKESFRRFEDGQFGNSNVTSRHDNVVKAVITAKKSWGLQVRMWSEGIADGDFTIREILDTFKDSGITVPGSLLKGFENEVAKRKTTKIDEYLKTRYEL